MTHYDSVRDQIMPGDVIAFGGKGRVSDVIKWVTRAPVSHVGVVRHTQMMHEAGSRYFCELVESTWVQGGSGAPTVGVQVAQLSQRVREYQGDIWWLVLEDDRRVSMDSVAGFNWLHDQIGKPYDIVQAMQSGLDLLDGVMGTQAREDFGKLFCSELVAGFLEAAGVVKGVNASETTPIDLARWAIWQDVRQLKGEAAGIPGFSTLNPDGWPQGAQ